MAGYNYEGLEGANAEYKAQTYKSEEEMREEKFQEFKDGINSKIRDSQDVICMHIPIQNDEYKEFAFERLYIKGYVCVQNVVNADYSIITFVKKGGEGAFM